MTQILFKDLKSIYDINMQNLVCWNANGYVTVCYCKACMGEHSQRCIAGLDNYTEPVRQVRSLQYAIQLVKITHNSYDSAATE